MAEENRAMVRAIGIPIGQAGVQVAYFRGTAGKASTGAGFGAYEHSYPQRGPQFRRATPGALGMLSGMSAFVHFC
jgi:hypothetical protein